jgi:S-adenosylmethionine:diacylglycerol 3-amino-3-carboxypropyl transferase
MTTHIRGLHEAIGLRTLRIAGAAADHGKLTATLSRLSHQRSLIARQLAVWTKKQQVTELRIGVLDKEITRIGRLIRDIDAPRRAVSRRNGTRAVQPGHQSKTGVAAVRRGDVSIDY